MLGSSRKRGVCSLQIRYPQRRWWTGCRGGVCVYLLTRACGGDGSGSGSGAPSGSGTGFVTYGSGIAWDRACACSPHSSSHLGRTYGTEIGCGGPDGYGSGTCGFGSVSPVGTGYGSGTYGFGTSWGRACACKSHSVSLHGHTCGTGSGSETYGNGNENDGALHQPGEPDHLHHHGDEPFFQKNNRILFVYYHNKKILLLPVTLI